jgi:hypothetical protein
MACAGGDATACASFNASCVCSLQCQNRFVPPCANARCIPIARSRRSAVSQARARSARAAVTARSPARGAWALSVVPVASETNSAPPSTNARTTSVAKSAARLIASVTSRRRARSRAARRVRA